MTPLNNILYIEDACDLHSLFECAVTPPTPLIRPKYLLLAVGYIILSLYIKSTSNHREKISAHLGDKS